MLKSNESELPACSRGSIRKSLFSKTLFAFKGPLATLLPGMITPPLTTGSGVMLILFPSVPIRNAVLGLEDPAQTPVVVGALQTERSPKPIPSAGVSTRPTPFFRSNARDQPPRSTVFLFPNSVANGPWEKPGFQATARRGPQFV